MNKSVKIFPTPYELAEKFAEELVSKINLAAKRNMMFTVALSGGSTPELLFSILGDHYSSSAHWNYVHFFWGDERCVPPSDLESNYGMTKRRFLEKINIPESNIHRIRGENDPAQEAIRYSEEVSEFTSVKDGLPLFDMVILGLGVDGHTASIFPGHIDLFRTDKICEVAVHPVTGQKRISLTGRTINNADSVIFLVTGKNKAGIVDKIINSRAESVDFPATYVDPVYGDLHWFIDTDAGSHL